MAVVEFGPFSLDGERCELLREGQPVRVQRKVFDFLAYLMEHRDRLVTKEELLAHVWQGTAVSESSLGRTAAQLRQLLGDDARSPRWIATVHGRGYRFLGEVSGPAGSGKTHAVDLIEQGALRDAPSALRDPRGLACGISRGISADFVGRESELKTVLEALRDRRSVRIAASIEGLPGIGKTELALQICGLCERDRSFRIFWFDAENPDLTSTWADVVAPHLGLRAPQPEQRAQLAVEAVEAMTEPVLLVLDNVEAWSAAQPGPRPRGAHIHWLVTTRTSDLGGREFHHIELPVLDSVAAEQLMVRLAGPGVIARPGFPELMEALGGYTISVELAATFLRRFPEITPAEYLADLEAGRASEHEVEVGPRTLYGRTLEAALDLLWARLPDRARSSWQLAACFAQAPATPALSDACGLDRRARAELRDHHLIETHPTEGWSMHRLVRAFGRRAERACEPDASRAAFLDGCRKRLSAITSMDDGGPLYRSDRPHFDSTIEGRDNETDAEHEERSWLKIRVAAGRYASGELKSARGLLEGVVADLSQLGTRAELRVAAEHALVCTLARLRDVSAQHDLLQECLPRAVADFGDSHRAVLFLRSNYGVLLRELEDYTSAKEVLEKVLQDAVCALGGEDPEIAKILGSLASVEAHMGAHARAKTLNERALRLVLSKLDDAHPDVALCRANVGRDMWRLGHLEDAREMFQLALASAEVTLGDHPNVQGYRRTLTLVMRELGQLPEAFRLIEAALTADERVLDVNDPRVAEDRACLGLLYYSQGELPYAAELLQGALESELALFGSDHFSVARTRCWLAACHRDMGNVRRAKQLLELATASDDRRGRAGHIEAGIRRAELAWVVGQLGDLDRARELLAHAEATVRAHREAHPEVAVIRARLAAVVHRQSDTESSRELATDACRLARAQPAGWHRRDEIAQVTSEVLGHPSAS